MGVALVVFSVPWDELLAVPNSRRKFVNDVGRKFAGRLASIDHYFRDLDPPHSCLEAVR